MLNFMDWVAQDSAKEELRTEIISEIRPYLESELRKIRSEFLTGTTIQMMIDNKSVEASGEELTQAIAELLQKTLNKKVVVVKA